MPGGAMPIAGAGGQVEDEQGVEAFADGTVIETGEVHDDALGDGERAGQVEGGQAVEGAGAFEGVEEEGGGVHGEQERK